MGELAGGLAGRLTEAVGTADVLARDETAIPDEYCGDESLTGARVVPAFVVRPDGESAVAAVVRIAAEHGVPITARGSATGLSGGCVPRADGIVVSFERMNRIREIDPANQMAVVEPGVTLAELDEATREHDLVYPVFPGESSASLGGNVATNAGGMRAVKYGVTRHQVVGLRAVLGTGEVIRSGGKFVKATSGYDLTQLIIGSEGTLALVTEATLRLYPRLAHKATILAPFASLDAVTAAVPPLVASGVAPLMVEYIDLLTMTGLQQSFGLDLGVPDDVKAAALAYLVVVLEQRHPARLEEDVADVAARLAGAGALDVYVLPDTAGERLIEAREKAFWVAKANHADEILDTVVPRAEIAPFMAEVAAVASEHASFVVGCGHAGDGNVHLSVFQPDPDRRHDTIHRILDAAVRRGGAISGEHGIGTTKDRYLTQLEDPAKLALMRRIKEAFDPAGILNPGTIFGAP